MNTQYFDPWEEANNPPEPIYQNYLWGQVLINAWACALVKGVGKVPYDPQEHGDNLWTAIDILINALPEMKIINDNILKRSVLASGKDWRTIIKPSIEALGFTDVRQIIHKWVKVETVNTGRKYFKDGIEKNETTFKFIQVFENEAACRADYLANNENGNDDTDYTSIMAVSEDKERKTAWAFAEAALKNKTSNCNTLDEVLAKIPEALAMYPQVAKYFSPESPEVKNWIKNWMASHENVLLEIPFDDVLF